MTEAVVMIRALICTERLKEICDACQSEEKYLKRIASEITPPNWQVMDSFKYQIEIRRWFTEASEEFIDMLEANVEKQKKKEHIKNSFTIRGFNLNQDEYDEDFQNENEDITDDELDDMYDEESGDEEE